MNRLHFDRTRVRGKACSLCQRPRREYVAIYYQTVARGHYLICRQCIGAIIEGLASGEAILTVPKHFKTYEGAFMRRDGP